MPDRAGEERQTIDHGNGRITVGATLVVARIDEGAHKGRPYDRGAVHSP